MEITDQTTTHDNNEEEPSFRPPKVQNFRSLKDDLIHEVKKQDTSLSELFISASNKKWEEQKNPGASKKVHVENKYQRLWYKILLIIIVLVLGALVGIRFFL